MKRAWRRTLILAALGGAALTGALSRAHDQIPSLPAAADHGPAPDPTQIPIDGLNLPQASLWNALEQIRAKSHLNLAVCWPNLETIGIRPDTPLHIRQTGPLSAADALRLVLDDASPPADQQATWWIQGDVIIVGGADRRPIPVRAYDLQPFLPPPGMTAGFMSYQDLVNSIIKLIEETTTPETWRDAGGTFGWVHESAGILTIGNIEKNHRQIEELLGQLLNFTPHYVPVRIYSADDGLFGAP